MTGILIIPYDGMGIRLSFHHSAGEVQPIHSLAICCYEPMKPFRYRLNSSLATQILLIVLAVTFVLIGAGAWLVHDYVISQKNASDNTRLMENTDTIEAALRYAFMENDLEEVKKIFFDLGTQNQANALRLLSTDSVVLASSIPDEIGIQLDIQGTTCQSCHSQNLTQLPSTEIQTAENSQTRVVVVANRLDNQIACQECHPENGPSLGVILVEFPAEQVESWHLPFDTGLTLGTLLLGIVLSGAIYFPLSKKVLQPISALAQKVDLNDTAIGGDAIQKITHRVEKIEADLDQSERNLADQHHKIDTIFSLQFDIEDPPSLMKFFRQSVWIVQQVTGYETITLRLFEPRTETFRVMAQTGMSDEMLKDLRVIHIKSGFHAEVSQTRLPAYTSDMANDPRMTSSAPIKQSYQSLVCIPLLAHDNLVGSMQIALKYKHEWVQDELRWLALIGRRIGLLIHQIQLTESLQDMAVLEERARVAQEIHDGLAQLVGSLRMWSEEALTFLEENNPAAAQKTIQKIENASSEAYASLRDEMLGLRDTIFPSKDLLKVITEYLNRFQRQWGIRTQLKLDDTVANQLAWPISPAAEIQLLRIIQEGMTNVRRHARASKISLSLEYVNDQLKVTIEDNGIGFDLARIPENRLGLRIMRERAATVGGAIQLSSVVGKGTQLEIMIPIMTVQNIQRGEG